MSNTALAEFESDVERGERFRFGKNWQRFLTLLNEDRIAAAQRSLGEMLGVDSLAGKSFIDIGSGSGLFSLAAMRLGAARVFSFDFDPQSVACAGELKRRYFPEASHWEIQQGSALDAGYVRSLGAWDIVYSWGVLHHTGKMFQALENVAELVAPDGRLFIAIYNDMGIWSIWWRWVKALYNRNALGRWLVLGIGLPYFVVAAFFADLFRGRNVTTRYRSYVRGMSMIPDAIDWLGGYPYEFAKPEVIFDFYRQRGFALQRLVTCGGKMGCNEFVFQRCGA